MQQLLTILSREMANLVLRGTRVLPPTCTLRTFLPFLAETPDILFIWILVQCILPFPPTFRISEKDVATWKQPLLN